MYVNAAGESGGRRHTTSRSAAPTPCPIGCSLPRTSASRRDFPSRERGQCRPVPRALLNCLTTSVTVNAEPRGSVTLGTLGQVDLRVGRSFKMGGGRGPMSAWTSTTRPTPTPCSLCGRRHRHRRPSQQRRDESGDDDRVVPFADRRAGAPYPSLQRAVFALTRCLGRRAPVQAGPTTGLRGCWEPEPVPRAHE